MYFAEKYKALNGFVTFSYDRLRLPLP